MIETSRLKLKASECLKKNQNRTLLAGTTQWIQPATSVSTYYLNQRQLTPEHGQLSMKNKTLG